MKGNRHAGPEITVSDKIDPKRFTTRPNAIKIEKSRIKKEYLKQQWKNNQIVTKELPDDYQLTFQKKFCRPQGSAKIILPTYF